MSESFEKGIGNARGAAGLFLDPSLFRVTRSALRGLRRGRSAWLLVASLLSSPLVTGQGSTTSYTFTTIAGNPAAAGTSDGQGSAARFGYSEQVAVDAGGNVYIADSVNRTIRKMTPAGVVTTIAGSAGSQGWVDGTGSAARFQFPDGIVLDAAGTIYVADSGNGIRKITPAGVVTTLAGRGGTYTRVDGVGAAAGFGDPMGLAVDGAGNLYVGDGPTIRKVTPAGVVTTHAGKADAPGWVDGTLAAARFSGVRSVVLSPAGDLYVNDGGTVIRRISAAGTVSTLAGIWNADYERASGSVDGTGSAARFDNPHGLALDAAGNLWVADSNNRTVRRVTPAGVVTTIAGLAGAAPATVDGVGGAVRFNNPNGIAIDAQGVIYVADVHAVRKGVPATVTPPTSAPTITVQPLAQTTTAGTAVTLTVAATGSAPLSYEWRRDGVAIPGATASTFTIPSVTSSAAGSYSVLVSNSAGSVVSTAAPLAVANGSALSNLSVRTTLADGQTLIVGAVVSGGSKNMLVRAAGPALNAFGLTGMSDPRLELYNSARSLIASNDDWPAALAPSFQSVGAFGFNAGSRDAALQVALTGAFTVQAKGTGSGVVLVEAYDVTGGVTDRLVNLSARNRVGTGSDILIAGFAVSGVGTKRVLIRAVGPTLGSFGVPGVLADPKLEVFTAGGVLLASNDNWLPSLSSTFAQVGAFALNADSRDAALLVNLNAGASYTVQVSGVNYTTGEALIEIYEVP
jgi:sugar lactone lactonase YvrE